MENSKILLSQEGKKIYLDKLYNEIIKILYIIEEENKQIKLNNSDNELEEKFSASAFIGGLLFEVNSFNLLFDNKLVKVIIKLNGIYNEYKTVKFDIIRRQVFEIRGIIDFLRKNMEE